MLRCYGFCERSDVRIMLINPPVAPKTTPTTNNQGAVPYFESAHHPTPPNTAIAAAS